jgi:hypothetical protein
MDPADDPDLLIEGEGESHNEELLADEWEPEEDATDDNTVTYWTSVIRLVKESLLGINLIACAQRSFCVDGL